MDVVEFLKEKNRMCESYSSCYECEIKKMTVNSGMFHCSIWVGKHNEEAVAIVEKWSAEHPIKTRQSEFLKMFPNAKFADGVIDICPCQIDTKIKDDCSRLSPCFNCRKAYWSEEVE